MIAVPIILVLGFAWWMFEMASRSGQWYRVDAIVKKRSSGFMAFVEFHYEELKLLVYVTPEEWEVLPEGAIRKLWLWEVRPYIHKERHLLLHDNVRHTHEMYKLIFDNRSNGELIK